MRRTNEPLHLLVLTGAGISAESGLATFRGAGGLWEGHALEDVATPEAWRRGPRLVWRFYQMRRAKLAEVEPNAAHRALAELEAALARAGHEFTLVTQNVDNLHQRAGSHPLAMHGSLEILACEACDGRVRDLEHFDPERFVPCPACGHERLRPDVVWFGEMPHHLDDIDKLLGRCTHFLAVGTSGVVWPAAGFLLQARRFGAETFVNALEAPENADERDRLLIGPATDVVPRFAAELRARLP